MDPRGNIYNAEDTREFLRERDKRDKAALAQIQRDDDLDEAIYRKEYEENALDAADDAGVFTRPETKGGSDGD
jgi:hypothetical protein